MSPLPQLAEGKLDVEQVASRHFNLSDMLPRTTRAADTKAPKVVIER